MGCLVCLTKNVLKIFSVQVMETFGEQIRKLREEKKLPIRKVAAHLDIDPSTLSKIERNERSANRKMISKLSDLFDIEEEKLLVNFLSDKVAYELLSDDCSGEVLKVAEEKIKYKKASSARQTNLEFGEKNVLEAKKKEDHD